MNPYDLFMSPSSISLLISPSLTLENLSDTSQFFGVSSQANESVGIIYFKEGFKYIGNLKNGIINGFGVAYWPEKTYEGEWRNNKREGKGIENSTMVESMMVSLKTIKEKGMENSSLEMEIFLKECS